LYLWPGFGQSVGKRRKMTRWPTFRRAKFGPGRENDDWARWDLELRTDSRRTGGVCMQHRLRDGLLRGSTANVREPHIVFNHRRATRDRVGCVSEERTAGFSSIANPIADTREPGDEG
jgi:hypothetical protein